MKIVQVINAMIGNSAKISNVIKQEDEYYFLFNEKHKWSISKHEGEYYLHLYPTTSKSIEELSKISNWNNYKEGMVSYSTDEIKTKEAIESFAELYQIVAEKVFGVDDIFDEIINS